MRWSTRPPADPQPWVRWFAWIPTQVEQGVWAWWEWIERQRLYPFRNTRLGASWYYRPIDPEADKRDKELNDGTNSKQ